jgi:hypothetical protein
MMVSIIVGNNDIIDDNGAGCPAKNMFLIIAGEMFFTHQGTGMPLLKWPKERAS